MSEPGFPELTSFGTLLKFALALEELAAERADRAADDAAGSAQRDRLAACAARHGKRARELERLRRERLNEVVLQPITGMERERYLPPHLPRPDRPATLDTVSDLIALEGCIARFYEDAANVAGQVLTGLDRRLRKLAEESRGLAAGLA